MILSPWTWKKTVGAASRWCRFPPHCPSGVDDLLARHSSHSRSREPLAPLAGADVGPETLQEGRHRGADRTALRRCQVVLDPVKHGLSAMLVLQNSIVYGPTCLLISCERARRQWADHSSTAAPTRFSSVSKQCSGVDQRRPPPRWSRRSSAEIAAAVLERRSGRGLASSPGDRGASIVQPTLRGCAGAAAAGTRCTSRSPTRWTSRLSPSTPDSPERPDRLARSRCSGHRAPARQPSTGFVPGSSTFSERVAPMTSMPFVPVIPASGIDTW